MSALRCFCVCLSLMSWSALAEETFERTKPTVGKISQQHIYYYQVSEYAPPVKVRTVTRAKQSLSEPESAVIAYLSAMMTGDYAWYTSLWDAESIRVMDENNRKGGMTKQKWLDAWKKTFDGAQVTLTHRVETGPYVIVGYSVRSNSGKADLKLVRF